MIPHDSGPASNGPLSAEVVEQVTAAITRYVEAPTPPNGDDLRGALRSMTQEARHNAMAPENVLVVLKDIWYALPAVRGSKDQEERVRLLQQVVTMCIKEYFD